MRKTAAKPVPVYYQLQQILLKEIEEGRWGPGKSIPPERALAERHKVSIGTVKKALLNLVYDGYLYRIQGKGTYVAGTALPQESLRYYRMRARLCDREDKLQVKLIELKTVEGFEPAARYLKVPPAQDLFEITRLFYSANQPVVLSISYLSSEQFHDITTFPQSLFERITLYEALEKNYGLPTIYNHELFGAIPADTETAGILEVPEGAPLLFMEMLSYTYRDRPYEYRKSYCVTGRRRIFREI